MVPIAILILLIPIIIICCLPAMLFGFSGSEDKDINAMTVQAETIKSYYEQYDTYCQQRVEEIEAEIFRGARVYADDLQHCIEVGEMEIPLKTGVISEADICGEIGELILGKKQGRRDDDEITIYDATGMALLDIAAAKAVLDMAEKTGAGQTVEI